jgi:hypothetical protein
MVTIEVIFSPKLNQWITSNIVQIATINIHKWAVASIIRFKCQWPMAKILSKEVSILIGLWDLRQVKTKAHSSAKEPKPSRTKTQPVEHSIQSNIPTIERVLDNRWMLVIKDLLMISTTSLSNPHLEPDRRMEQTKDFKTDKIRCKL